MLWKKVIRDLRENKGAYIACAAVMIIGLTIFSSYSIVIQNLDRSQKRFYAEQNFADGFAELKGMPKNKVSDLSNINGIKDIQGRLVKDVRVLLPGEKENIYLRLISVNPMEGRRINDLQLLRGTDLDSSDTNIWLDNKFLEANNLNLNEEIVIIAEGKKRSLRIVGFGRSPEFVYALRTSSDLFPDPSKFGIAFVPEAVMHNMFSEKQSVNSLVFTLEPGIDYEKVEQMLEPELERYGLEALYPRDDQVSHVLLSQELSGLRAMADTMPMLFLSVAAAILYIMLRRMIEQQRGQIGILKAFGYSNREILLHYISYPLVIGAASGVMGGLAGIGLSFSFTSLYRMFFNLPGLESRFSPEYLFLSIILSLVFSIFAGYQGCRQALRLRPAEAMRPPAPPVVTRTLIERIALLWNMFTVQGKMAVRNVFRNRRRTAFTMLGIMFAFSLGGMTWAMKDLSEQMLLDQYGKVQTYNVKVDLAHPASDSGISGELIGFPGVKKVETMAEIPVKLKHNWHEKDVVLLGLSRGSTMYNILDKDGKKIEPPGSGVLLSERLAQLLDARVGTSLTVGSYYMRGQEEKTVEVVGIIPQYLGLNAYMEHDALCAFIGHRDLATAAMLRIDSSEVAHLREEYRDSPVVGGINDIEEMYAEAKELMESFSGSILVFAFMAIVTGFAIIYNSSTITLSERSRELASMMVLGMTAREVLSVITFEQWFISVFGMLAGIPLTKLFLVGIAEAVNNDIYSMPTDMSALAVVTAFLITSVSIIIAQRAAAAKIRGLSLVEVLKAGE